MKFKEIVFLSKSNPSIDTGYYESLDSCVICTKVVDDLLRETPPKISITYSDRPFIVKSKFCSPCYPARMYVSMENNICAFHGHVNEYLYRYSWTRIKDKLFPNVGSGIRTVYFWIEKVE